MLFYQNADMRLGFLIIALNFVSDGMFLKKEKANNANLTVLCIPREAGGCNKINGCP